MKIGPYHASQVPGRPSQAPSGQPGKTQEAGDLGKSPAQSRSSADQVRNPEDIVQLSGAGGAVDPEPYGRIDYNSDKLRDRFAVAAKKGNRPDAPEGALTTRQSDDGRLERVRRRIETGFYERPDVKEAIASRLAGELSGSDLEWKT